MKFIRLFFFVLMAISIISCGDDDNSVSTNSNTATVIIPIKKGNYWRYAESFYSNYTMKMVCLEDSLFGSTKWTKIMETYTGKVNGKSNVFTYWATNTSYGFYQIDTSEDHTKYTIFPYPCSKNQLFAYYTAFQGRVVSMSESKTVPSGTYNCIKYTVNVTYYDEYMYLLWVCPGVGLVQQDVMLKTNGTYELDNRMVLTSYKIN